ncbi:alanine racemase [Alicyclobacillus hesperidum]|uniref:Alanine racemase n=2 Tax=Alicyclobacillus hesperidum TaxID=89784 RepID=A0AA37U6T6_9BACL|nr:alanine racemase [Alicyclobacillus hesperidum]GLV14374.1 alanine racemase [Alicyclobacillus hesperidum]
MAVRIRHGPSAAGVTPAGWPFVLCYTGTSEVNAMYRTTFAIVDLSALAHNIRLLKGRLAPGVRLLVAVKADAYGHGVRPVVEVLRREGVYQVAVASLEEALQIRAFDKEIPILILGALGVDECVVAAEAKLDVLYTDLCPIPDIPRLPRPLAMHIPIDTGMNRLGFKSIEAALRVIETMAHRADIRFAGVCTHLACADAEDVSHALGQVERLLQAVQTLRDKGCAPPLVHAANSAGLLRGEAWQFDMVRVGIAAYGYSPDPEVLPQPELHPVMHMYTSITRVADVSPGETIGYGATYTAQCPMRVATIAIGYADGFPRILSNRGMVRVRGRDVPIVGRVCMDQAMVDVSHVPEAQVGDFVTVFGIDPPSAWSASAWRSVPPEHRANWLQETFALAANEEGRNVLSLSTVAPLAETIPYEILCQINRRVPKLYVEA